MSLNDDVGNVVTPDDGVADGVARPGDDGIHDHGYSVRNDDAIRRDEKLYLRDDGIDAPKHPRPEDIPLDEHFLLHQKCPTVAHHSKKILLL